MLQKYKYFKQTFMQEIKFIAKLYGKLINRRRYFAFIEVKYIFFFLNIINLSFDSLFLKSCNLIFVFFYAIYLFYILTFLIFTT